MGKQTSQVIHIAPSARLRIAQTAAHVLAFVSILLGTLPPWLTAVLLVLVGASLAYSLKPQVEMCLKLHSDGRLERVVEGLEAQALELHSQSLVLSFVAVLLYKQAGRMRSTVVLSDCLSAEDFRQLRIWLLWRR